FCAFVRLLEALGYECDFDVLQVANYGVPQSRRRLVLLAGLRFNIPLPPATHSKTPKEGLKPWKQVKEVIRGMPKPITLEQANERGGPQAFNWHVVRTLAAQNRRRLAKAKPGRGWTTIPKALRPECHQSRKAGFSNVYGRMVWNAVS